MVKRHMAKRFMGTLAILGFMGLGACGGAAKQTNTDTTNVNGGAQGTTQAPAGGNAESQPSK